MTANNTRTRKSKGMKFQNWIAEELRAVTTGLLDPDDITTTIANESGMDIKLSPLGKDVIPFDIEAKRTEKLNIWGALKQTEENSQLGRIPLLVFRRNNEDAYACLKFKDLIKVWLEINSYKDYKEKEKV